VTRFRRLWTWRKDEEDFYRRQCLGSTLHVCCGKSFLGDVRLDIEATGAANVLGDYRHLPFRDKSFDTVICDPPWAKRERLDAGLSWIFELRRVARRRIVIVHNTVFSIPGTELLRSWAVRSRGLLWKTVHVHRVIRSFRIKYPYQGGVRAHLRDRESA
jgi:hypothetical protein